MTGAMDRGCYKMSDGREESTGEVSSSNVGAGKMVCVSEAIQSWLTNWAPRVLGHIEAMAVEGGITVRGLAEDGQPLDLLEGRQGKAS
jgi:hypothetical protein